MRRHAGVRWAIRIGERVVLRQRAPKLPPGPEFIPEPPRPLPWPYENLRQWRDENVPEGYRYQPATNGTGAGWVRPHGSN